MIYKRDEKTGKVDYRHYWTICPTCAGVGFRWVMSYRYQTTASEPTLTQIECDTCGGRGGWWNK